jgi:subtilisin family serine protease
MKKLDPQLAILLHRHKGTLEPSLAAALPPFSAGDEPLRVIIEFRGEPSDLEALGFVKHSLVAHPSQGYKIATGTIPVQSLEALAQIDHVVVVSAPTPLRPLLNYSADEIRALAVHRRNPGGATGRGVVIGIVDTGLEPRHGAFYDDNLKSRIIAFWDQNSHASDGAAGPGNLGRVYTRQAIEDALRDKRKLGTEDESGHGTMVAGIAAGDGSPSTCCVGGNTYVGVAPGAEILAVGVHHRPVALGEDDNVIHALDFIFNHPDIAGKPLVVNISLGALRGAHDGSTRLEKAIDAHVVGRAHSAVVVGNGNFADKGFHTKGRVLPNNGTLDVKFNIAEGDILFRYLEVWYAAGGRLNVKLIAPGNTVLKPANGTHPDGILPPDEVLAFAIRAQEGGGAILVNTHTAIPDNGDNRIQVTFNAGARPKGEWALQLINPTGAAIDFHAWLEREQRSGDTPPKFTNPTSDVTISIPATARQAIAVGSFRNRMDCCDPGPYGDIVESSSRGPVRKDANQNEKPNITAPGRSITSADGGAANLRGNCCDCCPDWCCCLYRSEDGTSLAAPHVAGTIALMLEVNPNLTHDKIVEILHDTALPAPAPADKDTWGAGKLNADDAVKKAAQLAGGGGGGTPTPALHRLRGRRAAAPQEAVASVRPAGESAMRLIVARLRAVPTGEAYAALISRHFSEGRRLINANPRIATMWQRGEGPKMLRRLLHGAIDESAEPPVRTATQRQYLSRFFDQLARFGSATLTANVHAHADELMRLLERPLAAQVVARERVHT